MTTNTNVSSSTPASGNTVGSTGLVASGSSGGGSILPSSSGSSASTSTNSSSAGLLVASGNLVITSGSNVQTGIQSPGSAGGSSRPEAEGASTVPLTQEEIELLRTTTPTAKIIREAVLGYDSRYRIFDTTTYPQRAISLIAYEGKTHCTGWLISPDTLVTAGHCLHDGGANGKWRVKTALRAYPGYSDGNAPYGSCGAKEIYAAYHWVFAADPESDIGFIKLDCTIGKAIGYFGYFVPGKVDGATATITGYPSDKGGGLQQWASDGTIVASTPAKLYYDNDTSGGMSGSPVWVRNSNDGSVWGIGIHAAAETTTNSGTRINPTVFMLMELVKNLP